MIISGIQTGNTRWLAGHLQNSADNEQIEVVEVSGTVAQDIDGALAEFDAVTTGTRATEGVYAAFISPSEVLTREQFVRAVELIEERLGLSGQPRIILFHEKQGREHCHIVWSRIDLDRMKAIQLSHDRQKLRRCAQELAAEFGTPLPAGLREDRGVARFEGPKAMTKAEKVMAEVSGISVAERRAAITTCYRQADTGKAFVSALEQAGYVLARGDKRGLVVVDVAGHVHSLARQIDGAKVKDVRAKLAGVDLSRLPPVEKAKVLMAGRAQARADALRADSKRKAAAKESADKLKATQKTRRTTLERLWQAMKIRQMHEWKVLLAHIKAEEERHLLRQWAQVGLAKYLRKIAVIRQLLEYYAERRRKSLSEYHRQLKASLARRHENEQRELKRRFEALLRLERREWGVPVFVHYVAGGTIDRQASGASYSFGERQVGAAWINGWYGMTVSVADAEFLPDQDPESYMRQVVDYELVSSIDEEEEEDNGDDPFLVGAQFVDVEHATATFDDSLSGNFNAAAQFIDLEGLRTETSEEETAGAHSAATGAHAHPEPSG